MINQPHFPRLPSRAIGPDPFQYFDSFLIVMRLLTTAFPCLIKDPRSNGRILIRSFLNNRQLTHERGKYQDHRYCSAYAFNLQMVRVRRFELLMRKHLGLNQAPVPVRVHPHISSLTACIVALRNHCCPFFKVSGLLV